MAILGTSEHDVYLLQIFSDDLAQILVIHLRKPGFLTPSRCPLAST